MFIALGMAAEIIMVVQYQDLLVGSMLLLIEIGRRQAADSATNNNQVIGFG